jgi:hypothetical protein
MSTFNLKYFEEESKPNAQDSLNTSRKLSPLRLRGKAALNEAQEPCNQAPSVRVLCTELEPSWTQTCVPKHETQGSVKQHSQPGVHLRKQFV